jgi:hypothetical protein
VETVVGAGRVRAVAPAREVGAAHERGRDALSDDTPGWLLANIRRSCCVAVGRMRRPGPQASSNGSTWCTQNWLNPAARKCGQTPPPGPTVPKPEIAAPILICQATTNRLREARCRRTSRPERRLWRWRHPSTRQPWLALPGCHRQALSRSGCFVGVGRPDLDTTGHATIEPTRQHLTVGLRGTPCRLQ